MIQTKAIFAVFLAYFASMPVGFGAQKAPTPFSTYGQIQNVQNYSSNPFWTPNSPYNQRMPTPIYATGADLNTGDCNRVVGNLVASFCASNNTCTDKKLSDVRPKIMVQLSQLPGHNFATSCGGYIDSEFENYKKTYGNVSTNNIVKPATKTGTIQFGNMFATAPSGYAQGVAERTAELERLQAQNTSIPRVVASEFPTTIDDLSFTDRMANTAKGYEPYKDMKSYRTIQIESDEDFLERLKVVNPTAYCARIVNKENDSVCTPQKQQATPDSTETNEIQQQPITDEDSIKIEAIVSILNPQNPAEEKFFTELATAYVNADKKDKEVLLDKNFIYDFLGTGDNLDKYRSALLDLTETVENEEFGIDIDWDDILTDISVVLDNTVKKRGMKVCENNRSLQMGLEVILDVATVAAAIFTLGGGGVAIAGARATAGAGLKALAKGTAKIGLKKTALKINRVAGKQLLKSGMRKVYGKQGARAVIKQSAKRVAKQVGANLSRKSVLLLDAGVVAAQIGKGVAKNNTSGFLYSLLSSKESAEILNCQDLDHNEGCYTICGDGLGADDLNTKVFQPILGKKYCVNPDDYALYEIKPNGQMGDLMVFNDKDYPQIRQALNNIKDKGKCDWNEDDIDAYIGYYIYDPDTLEISKTALYIDDMVRLDD